MSDIKQNSIKKGIKTFPLSQRDYNYSDDIFTVPTVQIGLKRTS